jgi:hypothetical protein
VGGHRSFVGAAAAAVLLALVLGAGRASAQTSTTTATTAPQTPAPGSALRVSAYGDSVLLGAKEELLADFGPGQATVDAIEDRSLLGAISLFQSAGPALGDVVVLDLGYNDASDPAVFRERIDGAMSALAGVQHVIWLNQHDWGPGRAGMNAELAAAATRYPTLEVVDWNAEVGAHPDYVYADSIHLTPAGQTGMATLVREHFDRYVASLTPTTTAPTSTTGAPATTAVGAAGQAAAPTADDGDGIDATTVGVVAVIALLVVVIVLWAVTARRRARRRARRHAERRDRRRVSAGGPDPPGAPPDR